jgi:hypothetical protein
MPIVTDPNVLARLNGGTNAPQSGPILGPPPIVDKYKEASEGRAEEDQDLQFVKDNRDAGKVQFDQFDKLRSDFDAAQPVKTYKVALPQYTSALQTDNTPQGDLNLIYAFAKAMDPDSVVREGEAASVANSDTIAGQTVARLKKELGNNGTFSPEARAGLRKQIRVRIKELNRAYNTERERFSGVAEHFGYDPNLILGEHFGLKFKPEISKYWDPIDNPASVTQSQDNSDDNAWLAANADKYNLVEFDAKGGELADAFHAGVGDVAQGLGNMVGIVGNPLNAGVNAVLGTNLSTDLGQTFRQATGAPDGNPIASAINQGGVAALTGAGAATQLTGRGLGGVVTNALSQQPIAQGISGAVSGGSSEVARQGGASPIGQAAAGLAGGVGAFSGTNALARLAQPKVASPVAQAAGRQNIQLMPADVGGPATRGLTAAAAQSAVSSPSVRGAAQRTQGQFKQAAQKTGGPALAPDDAGATVKSAGDRFVQGSQRTGGQLYDRAEKMAKGVSIKAKNAITTIDEQIAELQSAPKVNAPLIKELKKFRNDLSANGGVKVSGMRDLRTAAQKAAYTDDLRSTPAKRVLGIVADSISGDIDAGLTHAGRGNAAKAFKTADAYWRDRVEYIDGVLEPIIGKAKSGEAVLNAVEQMAQGKGKGVQTLMKLMRSVDKSEASDIRATIIDRMGRASAGQQNAEGTGYSATTFLTNWNKMSAKGKAAIFTDPAQRKNLDDLATVADSMKQSGKYANHSNTGSAAINQVFLSGGVGGTLGLPTMFAAGAAQYLTGKLLANPKFANWLAKVPANPQAMKQYSKQLSAIASAEPIIANDIASVQKFLNQAGQASPGRLAASENEGDARPKPPQ